jgi:hypothetical protein
MKKRKTYLLTFSLSAALLAITGCKCFEKSEGVASHGEMSEPVRIIKQPMSHLALIGGEATFQVTAEPFPPDKEAILTYQWLQGCTVVPGATTNRLVISDVGTNNVGFYTCAIAKRDASGLMHTVFTQPAPLLAYSTNMGGGPITVWSVPPPGGSGNVPTCPGSYVGYVNFSKPTAPYGWTPISGVAHSAKDTTRTDTSIKFFGSTFGNNGCGGGGFVNVTPINSTSYRFTVYFPSHPVPTTAYPLVLSGFNP